MYLTKKHLLYHLAMNAIYTPISHTESGLDTVGYINWLYASLDIIPPDLDIPSMSDFVETSDNWELDRLECGSILFFTNDDSDVQVAMAMSDRLMVECVGVDQYGDHESRLTPINRNELKIFYPRELDNEKNV